MSSSKSPWPALDIPYSHAAAQKLSHSNRRVGIGDIQAVAARWPCGIEVTPGIRHPRRIPQGWRLTAANPDPDADPATPNYGAAFDRDGDGGITVADIMRVAAQWDQSCP